MTSIPYYEIFKALTPQLMLTIGALVGLTLDLASLRRTDYAVRNRTVGVVAILALLATTIPLCQQLGQQPLAFLGRTLVVNNLTAIFNLVIVALTIITVVISLETDIGRHVGEYYATLLFGAIGMMLLVSTEELLTIFVALELTSICLYILTAFHKGALKSQEAAVKYFMFGAISSAFLLFGLSYVYGIAGTTDLRAIGAAVHQTATGRMLAVALLFTLVGLGFKIAVVPFHLWAPDAYEGAPTPVTAFIATGSKVASLFVMVKVLFVAFAGMKGLAFCGHWASGWTMLLAITAAASLILGNVVAIVQNNVKRLLAYSSIAHAGYILIGFVAANQTGATSVLFYIIVYALTNLGAFGVVVALANRGGGEELDHFDGMAQRAPFLSLLMLIFVLSLAGIPPLGGFFGKFYLFAAAVQRDAQDFGLLWLVILGIVMSAVSLYYYLILLKHMYIHAPASDTRVRTPGYLNAVLGSVAVAVILLGIVPERLLALLRGLVAQL
jgi:NADH-quinone oxidoreductase subunit N